MSVLPYEVNSVAETRMSGPDCENVPHYENKPIQIYWKFYYQKNEFSDEKF